MVFLGGHRSLGRRAAGRKGLWAYSVRLLLQVFDQQARGGQQLAVLVHAQHQLAAGSAPSNAYPCADGYVPVVGNGDSIFRRLMDTVGRTDLGIVPELSGTPGSIPSSAPTLGDDTDAVLREAGLTDTQIAVLREKGIVA